MTLGVLLALAGGAFFGLSNVIGRMAIGRASVYDTALWSVLVPSAVLLIPLTALAVTGRLGGANLRALPYFVAAGVLADFFARFSLFAASARLGASRASGFRVLAPVVTIAVGVLLLGDRLSGLVPAGLVLMLFGIGLVQFDAVRIGEPAIAAAHGARGLGGGGFAASSPARQGLALGLIAATAFGSADLLRKAGVDVGGSPFVGAFVAGSTALVLYTARGLVTGQARATLHRDRATRRLLAATGLALLCALVLFFSSLRFVPAGVAASVSGTQVLFAIFFGWLMNQQVERVSRCVVLGGVCVFGGLLTLLGGS